MSVIKFCDTEAADDLARTAGIVEVGSDSVKFLPLRTTDDGLRIGRAAETVVRGGVLSQKDLGKLLSYVADILGERSNYIE